MDLNRLTLIEAIKGFKAKDFSAKEITGACLKQIEATDKDLNAFVTVNKNALDEARAADKEMAGNPDALTHKPLLGMPVAIKDNFLTQGLRTTASSKVLDSYLPQYDATVVKKLKAAGAVILGKTNMDAWAHGSSTETSDYGPTKNPWDTGRLPGGSSGGSAAAVAADQCIFAIGSETAGSIRQPAAWCGVTGFKPTYGRVSRYGVIAMASSTDSPGPLTKNARDAYLLTKVLAGPDPYDGTTIPEEFRVKDNDLEGGVKGMKIGLPPEYLLAEMDKGTKELILQAAKQFESLGAKVIEVPLLDPHYSIGVYTILQRSEVSSNLARFDGVRYGNDRSHFGEEAKRRILLGTFSLSTGYYDEYYKKAQKVRTLIVEDFNRAFSEVDLIIGPTSPGPAQKLGATKDQPMFGEMEDILVEASSIAGLTGISVPAGFVDGLPIGLQITGPQRGEMAVLKAAVAYQEVTDWHLKQPEVISY